jgi:hypothetical protein
MMLMCGKSSKFWKTMPTVERSLERLVAGIADGDAIDDDLAALEGFEAIDALDQRRLAGTRRATDDDHLALVDLRRAVGEDLEGTVMLADLVHRNHRKSPRSLPQDSPGAAFDCSVADGPQAVLSLFW